MALIKCKECETEVSSKAETCPKCGARVASKPIGCGTVIVIFVIVVLILSFISSINFPRSSRTPSPPSTPPASSPNKDATSAQIIEDTGPLWRYIHREDAMGKGTVHLAQISSTNTVNFDFPYAGAQHGTLTLRAHPRYGKDIIFSIEKGQILCRSYEDCSVLVRFDDEPPSNYAGVGASDNSTETVYIRNYSKFVKKLLKAKQVRIATNIYKQGAPVFEFDVGDFDQDEYQTKR